ncbi:hypothetical protein H2200_001040 [Cladophialophora chaetospira]|uniref:Uncharacterized protein n=1 Tax=Cladophialophora chaetospira TaxID=386627 RepID=A0AA39CNN4_9EURO|nr:hypothetical protein H2200_001040 [Cladophialophora chaetospira]
MAYANRYNHHNHYNAPEGNSGVPPSSGMHNQQNRAPARAASMPGGNPAYGQQYQPAHQQHQPTYYQEEYQDYQHGYQEYQQEYQEYQPQYQEEPQVHQQALQYQDHYQDQYEQPLQPHYGHQQQVPHTYTFHRPTSDMNNYQQRRSAHTYASHRPTSDVNSSPAFQPDSNLPYTSGNHTPRSWGQSRTRGGRGNRVQHHPRRAGRRHGQREEITPLTGHRATIREADRISRQNRNAMASNRNRPNRGEIASAQLRAALEASTPSTGAPSRAQSTQAQPRQPAATTASTQQSRATSTPATTKAGGDKSSTMPKTEKSQVISRLENKMEQNLAAVQGTSANLEETKRKQVEQESKHTGQIQEKNAVGIARNEIEQEAPSFEEVMEALILSRSAGQIWQTAKNGIAKKYQNGLPSFQHEVAQALQVYDQHYNFATDAHGYNIARSAIHNFVYGDAIYKTIMPKIDAIEAGLAEMWNNVNEMIKNATPNDWNMAAALKTEIDECAVKSNKILNKEFPTARGCAAKSFKEAYLGLFRFYQMRWQQSTQEQYLDMWQPAHNALLAMLDLQEPGLESHQNLPTLEEAQEVAAQQAAPVSHALTDPEMETDVT